MKAPPVLRLVYITAAAVALAPRIIEDNRRQFGRGYSRDNMPRGLGDAAPPATIDAVAAASKDCGVRIVKWRDFLDFVKLVCRK